MLVSTDDIIKSVEEWIDADLMQKGTLFQQALMTFVILQGKSKLETMLSTIGFLADENGRFEYDDLKKNATAALNKMNGKIPIPVINYVFDLADLEKIFEHLKDKGS